MGAKNMQFAESVQVYSERFPLKGRFELLSVENLAKALKEVPTLPGVYIIYGRTGNDDEVVYIGKAGFLCRDGSFSRVLKNSDHGLDACYAVA